MRENFGLRISEGGFRIWRKASRHVSQSAIRNPKSLLALFALLLLFALDFAAFAQCSMCRTALESSPEGQAIAGGFRKGILLLLAAPYVIGGTISYAVYRAYRRR